MKYRSFVFSAGVVAALGFTAPALADIYQYTDADGVVHFTNSRPNDSRYKLYQQGDRSLRRGAGRNGGGLGRAPQDSARYTRFDEYIHQAATLYQIPEQLVRAVIKVESDFDPRAVSPAGARGLMQLMPGTAERLQVRDIDDPRENIFGGVRFLRVLANTFNGDLELTIAAYNAGEDAVMRHGGIPPYAETRGYVAKVTNFYHRYRTMNDTNEASRAD